MKLIVGLGNPGVEYARTRHNVGFMAVERLAARHGLSGAKTKFHAGVLEGTIGPERVLLMQPMTFMNRSGLSYGEAVRFHKLPLSEALVVVDDTALPLGALRLRAEGTGGGHNGLADIHRAVGSWQFPRLRIGVGSPRAGQRRIPQRDYVLGRFDLEEQVVLDSALDQAANAIECWITQGIDKAMSLYNTRPSPSEPETETRN